MSLPKPYYQGRAFTSFRDGGGYIEYAGETAKESELRVRRIRRRNRRNELWMVKMKSLNERPMPAMRDWAINHGVATP